MCAYIKNVFVFHVEIHNREVSLPTRLEKGNLLLQIDRFTFFYVCAWFLVMSPNQILDKRHEKRDLVFTLLYAVVLRKKN